MSLYCAGASTNSFRILVASSITARKSPTPKPKLIVTLVSDSMRTKQNDAELVIDYVDVQKTPLDFSKNGAAG